MKSSTSIAARQQRLREWADQICECNSRSDNLTVKKWCNQHQITVANYDYRLKQVRIRSIFSADVRLTGSRDWSGIILCAERMNQDYMDAKRYMADYRGELDSHEMFQNELALRQIDHTGAFAAGVWEKFSKLKGSPYFARPG